LALATVTGAAMLTAADDPRAGPDRKQAYGFRFLYTDKVGPKEYLQKHPCVSGIWRLKEETKTHWIGELHYPTANVPPAYPTKDEAAFVVQPIKVERQNGLPVRLKNFEGLVVLLQADPAIRFGTPRSLESAFKLVAVETEKGKGTGFLFQKHKDLKFSRAK
jgi:hypothetical protein